MLASSLLLDEPTVARPTAAGRDQRRMTFRVACRVRIADSHQDVGVSIVGETVNVSRRGVALRIGRELPIGTGVEVLCPMEHEPSCLYGRVVHCRRVTTGTFEIGVRVDTLLAMG